MIQRFRQFAADEDGMAMTEFVATLPVIIIIFVGIVKLHEEIIETFGDMGTQYSDTWEKATAMDARRSGESRPSVGTSATSYESPDARSVSDAFDARSLEIGAGVEGGKVFRGTHYQVYAHPHEVDFDTTANHIQGETIEHFERPLKFETRSYVTMDILHEHAYAAIAANEKWLNEDRMACYVEENDACLTAAGSTSHECYGNASECCEELAGATCQYPDNWGKRLHDAGYDWGYNPVYPVHHTTPYGRSIVPGAERRGRYTIDCFRSMGDSLQSAGDTAHFDACLERTWGP